MSANAQPRVSLLMPNRDNAPILDRVLDRLAVNSTYPDVELIAVDDGSRDGSQAILRRWRDSDRFPAFHLIEQEPLGVVAALNRGLAEATGELVVQLDADASVETPGWLERMTAFFLSDERIGVLTAKVVFDWGEVHTCGIDLIGPEGFHDRGSEITEPVGRREYHQRVVRRREQDCPLCESPAEVDAGMGACMMYRREIALAAAGYDDGFAPVWFDDIDLTLAIRARGKKVFFTPDVRIIHHVGRRTQDLPPLRRTAGRARRRAAAAIPAAIRRPIAQRLGTDLPGRKEWQRLEHHYAFWREKWGFDMLNPDMETVLARWGDTEVCWRYDAAMRKAGEEIISTFLTDRRDQDGRPAAAAQEK